MEEYRSNAHRAIEGPTATESKERPIEAVAHGQVKKRSGFGRVVEAFTPDQEEREDIKNYIFNGLVVPTFKDVILNTVRALLGMGTTPTGGYSGSSRRPSYSQYYNDRSGRYTDTVPRARRGYEVEEVLLRTRGEAEEVLDQMYERLDEYGNVSVGEYYCLVGISNNYTDYENGWTDLRTTRIERTYDGYYRLNLPRVRPLN